MRIGYARVSTGDQDAAAQVAALKAAGCERIFREKASGGRWDRPELHRLLDQLRKGDVLVVWKLDRLSRSLRDVLTIMERLGDSGAGFRSLTEAIDTTTPAGRMMMQMVGAFAEFERAMLKDRTKAGLDAAREEGRIGGRRPKLTPQQQVEIRKIVSKGDKTAADAARLFKIRPATVSRLLARTLSSARKAKHAMPNNVDGSTPLNSESGQRPGLEPPNRPLGTRCGQVPVFATLCDLIVPDSWLAHLVLAIFESRPPDSTWGLFGKLGPPGAASPWLLRDGPAANRGHAFLAGDFQ